MKVCDIESLRFTPLAPVVLLLFGDPWQGHLVVKIKCTSTVPVVLSLLSLVSVLHSHSSI